MAAIREELADRYGALPPPVASLLEVARLRARARRAGLTDVTLAGKHVRFAPVELPDSGKVRLNRLYPKSIPQGGLRTMLVPRPSTAVVGGSPLRDEAFLAWARAVIDTVDRPAREPAGVRIEQGEQNVTRPRRPSRFTADGRGADLAAPCTRGCRDVGQDTITIARSPRRQALCSANAPQPSARRGQPRPRRARSRCCSTPSCPTVRQKRDVTPTSSRSPALARNGRTIASLPKDERGRSRTVAHTPRVS